MSVIGMLFSHMMVKIIPTGADLSAVLAGVSEAAGEVDVLHMLAQVGAIHAHLAAHGAAMSARTRFRAPLYESIQLSVRL